MAPPFAAPVPAQVIPERPEDLRFAPSVFEPPPGLRFELGNGLPVHVVPDRSLPLVDVVLAFPVGDRDEGPGEDGLASMTAAMARRGGAGELGPDELDDEIDALGARIEASSSWGRTVLVLDSGSGAVDRGLELLAAILFQPRFDEARLEQAKENLRVSLLAAADDPRAVLEREWLRLVHGPGSPRSRRLTEASVAAFESEALAGFHRRHWSSRGAVIAASGDVDPESLVARLDELFGGWAPRPSAAGGEATDSTAAHGSGGQTAAARRRPRGGDGHDRPLAAPAESVQDATPTVGGGSTGDRGPTAAEGSTGTGGPAGDARPTGAEGSPRVAAASPGWWTIDRPGAQAAVALGHRGPVFASWDDPDRWALMLLAEILDGPGAVSRLRARLQLEEGLTYRVLSHFDLDVVAPAADTGRSHPVGEFRATRGERSDHARPGHPGEFRVFLETAPESAAEAAGAVLQELRRLQSDPAPAAELETAKRSVLARLPLLFDRAESVAGRRAEDDLLGRPHEYWADYRQRLRGVTGTDVRRAARRFLDPGGVALLVVGDWNAVRSGRGFQELRRAVGPPRVPGEESKRPN